MNFKTHSTVVLLTSKTLYCNQYSADFTYFVPLAREFLLYSWLTFRENGTIATVSHSDKQKIDSKKVQECKLYYKDTCKDWEAKNILLISNYTKVPSQENH